MVFKRVVAFSLCNCWHFCKFLNFFCTYLVCKFFRLEVLPGLFCKLFPSLVQKGPYHKCHLCSPNSPSSLFVLNFRLHIGSAFYNGHRQSAKETSSHRWSLPDPEFCPILGKITQQRQEKGFSDVQYPQESDQYSSHFTTLKNNCGLIFKFTVLQIILVWLKRPTFSSK